MRILGTEVFLDSLSTLFNKDHSFMLSALQCLRLSRRVRDQTGAILSGRKIKVNEYHIRNMHTLMQNFMDGYRDYYTP